MRLFMLSCPERLLSLFVCDADIRIPRSEPTFKELNTCAVDLKRILGRIPDQIYDRKQFLDTIK